MNTYIPSTVYEAPPFPEIVYVANIIYEEPIAKPKRSILRKLSLAAFIVGVVFLLASYGPSLIYSLRGSENISQKLLSTVSGQELPVQTQDSWQPTFDRNLPIVNSVSIPSIGVKTEIEESPDGNYEEALKNGVWRVNDFGTPYNREQPTILAAHRFGYLAWSLDFRLHHSFYNLPQVKVGDTVEIVWRQRKYVYAVYKEETSKEISDYSADLILYTCEDLSGDLRVIKYARLLKI